MIRKRYSRRKKEENDPVPSTQSPITNHQSPIPNCQLSIVNYQLSIVNYLSFRCPFSAKETLPSPCKIPLPTKPKPFPTT
ncbi:hypothetical protein FJR04_22075 [Anabaena sp. UHCC 0204]|nr:hypothetical protein [Anabaena sp. UHCC 0204]